MTVSVIEITVRLNAPGDCRRRTVRLNPEKEAHQKAIEGLQALRANGCDTHDEIMHEAVYRSTMRRDGSLGETISTLQTEWTQTEEPLSESVVIRECLRRAGQQLRSDGDVERGDGIKTDGGARVSELFGELAQLAEETAEVDDDDGLLHAQARNWWILSNNQTRR